MATRPRLLIIEDNRDFVKLLRYRFSEEGFAVSCAPTGEKGLALAAKEDPALVILDVMLPGMDGLEVCQKLRQRSAVPVVFLTARGSEVDRVLGFKLGGDDYVTKPFSISELVARVRAILKRKAPADARKSRSLGGIKVDHDSREVRVAGKAVKLTPKEFSLLELLMDAGGKVVSRSQLMKNVWGYDRNLGMDDRRVDHLVCCLRRNLKSEGSRILTVSGSGYRVKTT